MHTACNRGGSEDLATSAPLAEATRLQLSTKEATQ